MKGQSLKVKASAPLPGYVGATSWGPLPTGGLCAARHALAHFATRVSTIGNRSGSIKAGKTQATATLRHPLPQKSSTSDRSEVFVGSRMYALHWRDRSQAEKPAPSMFLMTLRVF